MDELTRISFPITKRIEFAKHLGVPSKELHTIELKALSNTDTKRVALKEIVRYWFEHNPSASFAAVVQILETKMGMNLEYESQVRQGKVAQLGSIIEERDIEGLLQEIIPYIPDATILACKLRIKGKFAKIEDNPTRNLCCALKTWIQHRNEDATWNTLIRKLRKADPVIASRIKKWRCQDPNKVLNLSSLQHSLIPRTAPAGKKVQACMHASTNIVHVL